MLYKSLKHIKLKVTPTCFGSHEIHHQGQHSRASMKLLAMVHRHLSCARSVFGSVIFVPVVSVHCATGKVRVVSVQNCFEGWTRRWHRCIASQGEYFEGDHGGIQQ